MDRKIAGFMLATLLSSCSFFAFAAEEVAGNAAPPTAIPGVNQSHGSESNDQKANKKGEEAAGSNSDADSQAAEKEASSSSGSTDDEK